MFCPCTYRQVPLVTGYFILVTITSQLIRARHFIYGGLVYWEAGKRGSVFWSRGKLFCFVSFSFSFFLVFVHSQVFYCLTNHLFCMFCLLVHVSCRSLFYFCHDKCSRYFIVVLGEAAEPSVFGRSASILCLFLFLWVFVYCYTSDLRGRQLFFNVPTYFYLCGLPVTVVYFSVGEANCFIIMDVLPMYLLVRVTSYFVLVTMTFQITRARVFILLWCLEAGKCFWKIYFYPLFIFVFTGRCLFIAIQVQATVFLEAGCSA